jgi:hypothetical protein
MQASPLTLCVTVLAGLLGPVGWAAAECYYVDARQGDDAQDELQRFPEEGIDLANSDIAVAVDSEVGRPPAAVPALDVPVARVT